MKQEQDDEGDFGMDDLSLEDKQETQEPPGRDGHLLCWVWWGQCTTLWGIEGISTGDLLFPPTPRSIPIIFLAWNASHKKL